MELCDCEFLCTKCSSALMPFFSVGNLEFKMLNHLNDANEIKYDEYCSPYKLSKLSSILTKNDFFIQHFNVRRLSKNKEKIEEFFDGITRLPDAIAISETKLNSNSVSNLIYQIIHFFVKIHQLVLVELVFTFKEICNIA